VVEFLRWTNLNPYEHKTLGSTSKANFTFCASREEASDLVFDAKAAEEKRLNADTTENTRRGAAKGSLNFAIALYKIALPLARLQLECSGHDSWSLRPRWCMDDRA